MKYSVDKHDQYTILKPETEKLDSTKAPALKSEIVTLQAEGTKNLILDLSDIKYIDSSGLSSLLVGDRIYKEADGSFILTGISDHVMKLIKISQLDTVLSILPKIEEAVDAVFFNEIEKDLKNSSEE